MGHAGGMIASITTAASALRPVERPSVPRPPVEPAPAVEQVRAQAPTPQAAAPRTPDGPPPQPSRPLPRGSMLDLSV
jgi:hypothetical protein